MPKVLPCFKEMADALKQTPSLWKSFHLKKYTRVSLITDNTYIETLILQKSGATQSKMGMSPPPNEAYQQKILYWASFFLES